MSRSSVVEQPVPAARGEVGVQQPEIRDATRIRDDGFAVQDQVLGRQGRQRIGNRLKAPRPVVAPPCVNGRPPASQVRLRSVAVELDLMHPALACRGLLAQRRATWFDESGERRRLRAGQHAGVNTLSIL